MKKPLTQFSLSKSNHIGIIDCAIQELSLHCFNRLLTVTGETFSYHLPPHEGTQSLHHDCPKAWILFGSKTNVTDRLTWHKELQNFLRKELESHIPVLGICFGHQLLADEFGAEVGPLHEDGHLEEGPRTISLQKTSSLLKTLKAEQDLNLMVSHGQVVKNLSPELETLAHSPLSKYEVIAHKTLPFVGIQAHPEASPHFMHQHWDHSPVELTEKIQQKLLNGGDTFIKAFTESLPVKRNTELR